MAKQITATVVGSRLRSDILHGRLRPGQRLMFPVLCRDYAASVGAIREALLSLTSQGLVKAQAHQGFVVAPLTREDLLELTATRMAVEPIALRDAIRNGDLNWESRAITSHHLLSRTPRDDESAPTRVADGWVIAHEAFHAALFSGCANGRLRAIVQGFAEEAALYRRWSVPLETDRDVAAEHAALLQATIDRDADLACECLLRHIGRTTELLITQSPELIDNSVATAD